MSDCSNADIRDLLPDMLHDRLDAPTRAQVLAHVNGCADCRSELELLRSMRGALHRDTPRVDVNRIVAALPAPASARPSRHLGTRVLRGLNDWRIAAAVTFLVAGTSVVLMHGRRDGRRDSTDTAAVATTNEQGASLGNSRIDDLNARQLKSLLDDIDHMDATPITDPEPVTLRVGARPASPTGL